ncbi:MAG: hypothetical protein EXQ58_04055 [Acidobacteria bacterium]|nr:hypothetical protein [Acidobacteriota bacterium]
MNPEAVKVCLDFKISQHLVATITAQFTVVVGSWQRKAHNQQTALAVATKTNELLTAPEGDPSHCRLAHE